MAIKGSTSLQGISVSDVYIKILCERIDEVPIPILEDLFEDKDNPKKKTGSKTTGYTKTFRLNYGYYIKPSKEGNAAMKMESSCEVDLDKNLYAQAYADIANKLTIDSKEI